MQRNDAGCLSDLRPANVRNQPALFAVGRIARLDSDDLIETLNDLRNLLGRGATESRADAFDRQRANLADLDPRALRQFRRP